MRYISVCSGIEAATVAWHPLGWTPTCFAEIERFPSQVLAHHYPTVPNVGDFTSIQEGQYDAIDLMVGGTPCQDFSVAGLRAGMDGKRGQLTVEFARLAGRLRSRWMVWENVPGVLSIDGGRAFGAFLGILGKLGYGFAYRVLDAQHFGVPQRRRRVFVVGYLGDWRCAAAVLFERHGLSGHPAPRREAGKEFALNVAPCLRARSNSIHRADTEAFTASTGDLSHCLNAGGMGRQDYETETLITHAIQNATRGKWQNGLGVSDDGSMYTLDQGSHHAVAFAQPGMKQQSFVAGSAIGWSEELTASVELAGTVQRGGQGGRHEGVMTPTMAVRRLTPRECERLQGFPDEYTRINEKTADGPRYKALGNSMAVPVMRWIGERIQAVDCLANPERKADRP